MESESKTQTLILWICRTRIKIIQDKNDFRREKKWMFKVIKKYLDENQGIQEDITMYIKL